MTPFFLKVENPNYANMDSKHNYKDIMTPFFLKVENPNYANMDSKHNYKE